MTPPEKDAPIRVFLIDDQYALGEKRDKPKVKYLQDAINAALKGEDPRETRTAAPGAVWVAPLCGVPSSGGGGSVWPQARHGTA